MFHSFCISAAVWGSSLDLSPLQSVLLQADHCNLSLLQSLLQSGLLRAMVVVWYPRCPHGDQCSKGNRALARCTTREQAELKLQNHLINSPFHNMAKDEAVILSEISEIDEWDNSDGEADEPEVWKPRTSALPEDLQAAVEAVVAARRPAREAAAAHMQPAAKRQPRHGPYGPLPGPSEAAPRDGGSTTMAAMSGNNQQVADFMHNQIRTAMLMTKVSWVH